MDDHLELLLSGQQYKKLQEVAYKPITSQYQISILDLRVLLFLYEHEKYDTAKDMVEVHYLTKSYVSKAVDSLIEKNYLRRKKDDHDRRCVHLELQDTAIPVVEAAKGRHREMLQYVFKGISKEEVDMIRHVAIKINANIADVLA